MLYPINFMGHDEWLMSGYEHEKATGDVVTRDGEVIGTWRVVDYCPEEPDKGGRYEFLMIGEYTVKFAEGFGDLDIRMSRGVALSKLARLVREWHDCLPGKVGL